MMTMSRLPVLVPDRPGPDHQREARGGAGPRLRQGHHQQQTLRAGHHQVTSQPLIWPTLDTNTREKCISYEFSLNVRLIQQR